MPIWLYFSLLNKQRFYLRQLSVFDQHDRQLPIQYPVYQQLLLILSGLGYLLMQSVQIELYSNPELSELRKLDQQLSPGFQPDQL